MTIPTISVMRHEKFIYGNYKRMDYTYDNYYRMAVRYLCLRLQKSYSVYAIYIKVEYYSKLPYSDLFYNYILY